MSRETIDWPAWAARAAAANSVDAWVELAVGLAVAGLPLAAENAALRALDCDHQRPDGVLLLADLLARREPARAELYYQQAWQHVAEPRVLARLLAFYVEQNLPYAAQVVAQRLLELQPDDRAADLLAALQALYPPPEVAVYLVAGDDSVALAEQALTTVFSQTLPAAKVTVLDRSESGAGARVAEQVGAAGLWLRGRSLPEVRNLAMALDTTPYLAFLDADLLADRHWLERLLLPFDRVRLLGARTTEGGAPLAATMGAVDDAPTVWQADLWRHRHLPASYAGRVSAAEAPWICGGNAVYRREVCLQVGGWPTDARRGEDIQFSERLRQAGFRLGYAAEAVSRRARLDSLPTALTAAVGYQPSYIWQHRFSVFQGGGLSQLRQVLPETVERWGVDRMVDDSFRTPYQEYATFLLLPWLVLSDLHLAATTCAEPEAVAIVQTHAAVFLALFTLLAESGQPLEFLYTVHQDLQALRPDHLELAALCGWQGVEATLQAVGGHGFNPLEMLPLRDADLFAAVLRAIGGAWLRFDELAWATIRAAAWHRAAEEVYRASLPPQAWRATLAVPPGPARGLGPAGSPAASTPLDFALAAQALRHEGAQVMLVDGPGERLSEPEFPLRVAGTAPEVILLAVDPADPLPDLDRALAILEQGGEAAIYAVLPTTAGAAQRLLATAPQRSGVIADPQAEVLAAFLRAARDGGELPPATWLRDAGPGQRPLLPTPLTAPLLLGPLAPEATFHPAAERPLVALRAGGRLDGRPAPEAPWQAVMQALQSLVEQFTRLTVVLDGDLFATSEEAVLDFCGALAEAGLPVQFLAAGPAARITASTAEALAAAGVVAFQLLPEQASRAVVERARLLLQQAGVTVA
ncbi:MAG: glycosyltransferase [Fimbriimonadaceae bacterium]|nr:glycosyltransferase [Fimbriimonadaceae bacterium]